MNIPIEGPKVIGIIFIGIACLTSCASSPRARSATAPLSQDSGQAIGMRYLAADPALRLELSNARLVVGQAVYLGPLLTMGTANWEKDWYFRNHGPVSYDPVLYPKHPWRWWYMLKNRIDGSTCWAYAESSDGIHWNKPVLNPKGDSHTSEPNNLVTHRTGYLNPNLNSPASERYLSVYSQSTIQGMHQLWVRTSPDGNDVSAPILVFNEPDSTAYALDGGNQLYWDVSEQKYVLTVRYWYDAAGNPYPGSGMHCYRGGATRRSTTIAGLLNAPLEHNLKSNVLYGPITGNCDDIYMTNIVPYHGQFIATPNIFHSPRDNRDKSETNLLGVSGPVYPQLLYSRDSKTWYADAETKGASLIDLNHHNPNFKTDGDMIFMEKIVEQGTKLWFFYSYRDFPHNSFNNKNEKTRSMTTHIAQMRLDGFMGIANQPGQTGVWTTPPLEVPANSILRINALVGNKGAIRLELLNDNNIPIAGYTAKDAIEITKGDHLTVIPKWLGTSKLKSLANRRVKLHFQIKNAEIFSFEFAAQTSSENPP